MQSIMIDFPANTANYMKKLVQNALISINIPPNIDFDYNDILLSWKDDRGEVWIQVYAAKKLLRVWHSNFVTGGLQAWESRDGTIPTYFIEVINATKPL